MSSTADLTLMAMCWGGAALWAGFVARSAIRNSGGRSISQQGRREDLGRGSRAQLILYIFAIGFAMNRLFAYSGSLLWPLAIPATTWLLWAVPIARHNNRIGRTPVS